MAERLAEGCSRRVWRRLSASTVLVCACNEAALCDRVSPQHTVSTEFSISDVAHLPLGLARGPWNLKREGETGEMGLADWNCTPAVATGGDMAEACQKRHKEDTRIIRQPSDSLPVLL